MKTKKIFLFVSKNIFRLLFFFLLIWLIFFDENALIRHVKLSKEIKTQEKEIERLREIIRKDSTLISIFNSDTLNPNLEKILREEYLLSKPNEIIYKIEK